MSEIVIFPAEAIAELTMAYANIVGSLPGECFGGPRSEARDAGWDWFLKKAMSQGLMDDRSEYAREFFRKTKRIWDECWEAERQRRIEAKGGGEK